MDSPEAVAIIVGLASAFLGGYVVALWRVDRWLDAAGEEWERGFKEDQ